MILDGSSACDAFENLIKNDLKEFEFISNTLSGCAACDTQMFGMMPQFLKDMNKTVVLIEILSK